MGREVQGVSQSRAYLMEVSRDREGFPYQIAELFLHSTPCNLHSFLSAAQTRQLTFSLPLQVGHPVLPPSGFHPCVHHGAGPGGQAGARVQQAQRQDDRALHRQRAGPPLVVQGNTSGQGSGGSLQALTALEGCMSHPKAWGCWNSEQEWGILHLCGAPHKVLCAL